MRLFTEVERELPLRSLAARFAAKEALAKALGAPRGLLWSDAEVRRGENGRPSLHVCGTVAAAASALGVDQWHISLSHDGGIATAIVIAEQS
jgi:holo-[acyl-carrier protein] synthase